MKNRSVGSCHTVVYIAFILVAATLPYLNTLNNGFVFDDLDLIVKNRYIRNLDLSFLKEGFTNRELYNVAVGEIYRPLYIIMYAVEYRFWGLNPEGYHAVNVVLNATNAVVVYLLLHSLIKGRIVALGGAIIFALLPVHTENVAWIKEQTTLLSSLFMFLAILIYLKYRVSGLNRWLVISLMSFALSLLSKETAVVLPLIIVSIDLLLLSGDRKVSWLKRLLPWVLFISLSLAFLWLRTIVLKQVAQQPYYYGGSLMTTIFTMFRVVSYYIKLIIFPMNLCADYYQYPLSYRIDAKVMASVAVIVGLAVICLATMARKPLISMGIIFFFVCLLPVSNIIPTKILIAERFLYLPSFGLILAVISLVDIPVRSQSILLWIAVFIMALFSIITYNRNFVWRNQYTFWADVVRKMPGNSRAHYNLALSTSNHQERIEELKKTLYINPVDLAAMSKLAKAYSEAGNYDLALQYYADLLRNRPNDKGILNDMGIVYYKKGEYKKAKEVFEEMARLNDKDPKVLTNLGTVHDILKEYDKAIAILNKVISLSPDYADAYYSLGIAYNNAGMYDKAIVTYKKALIIDNNSERAHFGMGETYFKAGDHISAIREFTNAIDINPKNFDSYYNLAYIYALKKDFKASINWLERATGKGFRNFEAIKRDEVFAPITGDIRRVEDSAIKWKRW